MQPQNSTTFAPPLFRSHEMFLLPNASSASSLAQTTVAGKSSTDQSAQSSVTERQRPFISPNSSMIHHSDEDVILNIGSLIAHSNESTQSAQRLAPLDISTTALSESILTDAPNQVLPHEESSSRRGSGQSIQFLAAGVGGAASPTTSGAPSPIVRNSQRGSNQSLASNSNSASECHLNIAWASEEDIPYARLPPGRTITVFAPNIRTPAEVFPSQHILVTKCTRMLPPNHAPLAHCAHYHYNRRCLRGDQCGFVHVARFQGTKPPLDASISPTSVAQPVAFMPPGIAPQPTMASTLATASNPQQQMSMVLWPSGAIGDASSQGGTAAMQGRPLLPSFAPTFSSSGAPPPQMQMQAAPQYLMQQGQTITVLDQYGNPTRFVAGPMPQPVQQVQVAMPQGQFAPQQQQFFSVYAAPQAGVMSPPPGFQWPTPQQSPTSFQPTMQGTPGQTMTPYMGMVSAGGHAPSAVLLSAQGGPGQPQPFLHTSGATLSAQPLSQFPRLR